MTVGILVVMVWFAAIAVYLLWQFAAGALAAEDSVAPEPPGAAACLRFETVPLRFGQVSPHAGFLTGESSGDGSAPALRPFPPTAA